MTQTHLMSHWERVFLTNAVSLPFTFVLFMAGQERKRLSEMVVGFRLERLYWVVVSCFVGVGISFTGWKLRDEVSATAFTLIGVLNKIFTIAVNAAVFHDGSFAGTMALVMAVVSGLMYDGVQTPASSCTAVRGGPSLHAPTGAPLQRAELPRHDAVKDVENETR